MRTFGNTLKNILLKLSSRTLKEGSLLYDQSIQKPTSRKKRQIGNDKPAFILEESRYLALATLVALRRALPCFAFIRALIKRLVLCLAELLMLITALKYVYRCSQFEWATIIF
jgi:hypothetical protein